MEHSSILRFAPASLGNLFFPELNPAGMSLIKKSYFFLKQIIKKGKFIKRKYRKMKKNKWEIKGSEGLLWLELFQTVHIGSESFRDNHGAICLLIGLKQSRYGATYGHS